MLGRQNNKLKSHKTPYAQGAATQCIGFTEQ